MMLNPLLVMQAPAIDTIGGGCAILKRHPVELHTDIKSPELQLVRYIIFSKEAKRGRQAQPGTHNGII